MAGSYGIRRRHADQVIRAGAVGPELAAVLRVNAESPLPIVERIRYSQAGGGRENTRETRLRCEHAPPRAVIVRQAKPG